VKAGLTPGEPTHRVSKYLQQGIESDHFHVKKNMPKIGGFQSFPTAKERSPGSRQSLVEERLRLCRGMDRSQTERSTRLLPRTSNGE